MSTKIINIYTSPAHKNALRSPKVYLIKTSVLRSRNVYSTLDPIRAPYDAVTNEQKEKLLCLLTANIQY